MCVGRYRVYCSVVITLHSHRLAATVRSNTFSQWKFRLIPDISFVAEYDIVRHDASLLFAGPARNKGRLSGYEMAYFDCVAEGIYIGIGSLHIIVYGDAPSFSMASPASFGQFDFRAYPDAPGKTMSVAICLPLLSVRSHHRLFSSKRLTPSSSCSPTPLSGQLPVHDCGHREKSKASHHLVWPISHHVDLDTMKSYRFFRHFQSG